jgi:hypothetical protein
VWACARRRAGTVPARLVSSALAASTLAALVSGGVAAAAAGVRFSHQRHAQLLDFKQLIAQNRARHVRAWGNTSADFLPCADCHRIDGRTGAALAPGADAHRPCSNASCHGAHLGEIDIPGGREGLCEICHDRANASGATPSRLVVRSPADREHRVRFNHRQHLPSSDPQECDSCHTVTKTVKEGRAETAVHRPAHRECIGCHSETKTFPQLTLCAGCHFVARPRPALAHAGSKDVGAAFERFSHDLHHLDIRTARVLPASRGARGWSRYDKTTALPLGCGACHLRVKNSTTLDKMSLLPQNLLTLNPTCIGRCHNGTLLADATNDCGLCHGDPGLAGRPLPQSHRRVR